MWKFNQTHQSEKTVVEMTVLYTYSLFMQKNNGIPYT